MSTALLHRIICFQASYTSWAISFFEVTTDSQMLKTIYINKKRKKPPKLQTTSSSAENLRRVCV